MEQWNELTMLVYRLKKIGIEIELGGNFPWIYLGYVNGNRVQKEDFFEANHGFTIAFYPKKDTAVKILDIGRTFKVIRKYL